MDREKIIKAGNCCLDAVCADCPECPYTDTEDCQRKLSEDALALIKELCEEVTDLRAIAEQYQKQFEDCYEENERLKDISCKASARIYELQRELDSPKRRRTKTKRHDEPYQYGIKFTEEGETIE